MVQLRLKWMALVILLGACQIEETPVGNPENFKLSAISQTQISLSWAEVPGVSGYTLERKAEGGEYDAPRTLPSNAFVDSGLNPGISYTYRLKAIRDSRSSSGLEQTIKTLEPTKEYRFSLFPRSISLAQGGSRDVVVNIERDGYTGPVTFSLNLSTPGIEASFVVNPANQDQTTLKISVAKTLAVGEYSLSVIGTGGPTHSAVLNLSVTPYQPPVVTDPADFQLTAVSPNQIDLSWAPIEGASYTLERKTATTGYDAPRTLSTTLYQDTGLLPGTTYTYRLKAVIADTSSPGLQKSVTTELPDPPNFLLNPVSPSQIDLSWTAVTGASYTLERKTASTNYDAPRTLTATTFQDKGLLPGTAYTYRLKAITADASSSGLQQSATTLAAGYALSAPSTLSLEQGSNTSFAIQIDRSQGYSGAVQFSLLADAANQGIAASFSPNPSTTNQTTLSLSVASTTSAGNHTLVFQGVGGPTRTVSLSLTVSALPALLPPKPESSLPPSSNPITVENQNAGDEGWSPKFWGAPPDKLGDDILKQIKGYASATSVNVGESIDFKISTTPAQPYTLRIYRVGYYGGKFGRLMKTVSNLQGITQPACPQNAQTGLTECNWSKSYTLNIPSNWVSGFYTAVLENQQGFKNWMNFTLRDDNRQADFLSIIPTTTFQAYNFYPKDGQTGKNSYTGDGNDTIGGLIPYGDFGKKRAVKVSFDRPYDSFGDFHNFWFGGMAGLLWMEKEGYNVAYADDIYLHEHRAELLKYKGLVFAFHDEYWSKEMFDHVEAARDKGVNLAFFSANDAYWQIRLKPSSSGVPNRIMEIYKDPAKDPEPNPALKTTFFRDVGRPEQTLMGVQFTTVDGSPEEHIAYNPQLVENQQNWLYAGTGLKNGDKIKAGAGMEVDKLFAEYPKPPGKFYQTLGTAPFAGDVSQAAVFQVPSGAWVFSTGALSWVLTLSPYADNCCTSPAMQQLTRNLFARFLREYTTPYKTTAAAIPGKIQAEDFDADGEGMAYVDKTNTFNTLYRPTTVDLGASSDPQDSTHMVQQIQGGEWLQYTLKAAEQKVMRPKLRLKGQAGSKVRLEINSTLVGEATLSSTDWTTLSLPAFTALEGRYVARVSFEGTFGGFSWLEF